MQSLFALILLAQPAPPPTVEQVVDGIQKFYADARDLQANFTQTYTYKVYGRTQISNGVVYFKKPGMMRWDYQRPAPKVFVADGQVLWVYEPNEGQAFKKRLADAQLPVALTFMSGKGKLSDEFDAKLLPAKESGTHLVELVPRRHAGDYKSLRLTIDAATFAVKASTVVDPVGNTNHLVFSDVKTNGGLPDAGFRFRPPQGVRVIEGPKR